MASTDGITDKAHVFVKLKGHETNDKVSQVASKEITVTEVGTNTAMDVNVIQTVGGGGGGGGGDVNLTEVGGVAVDLGQEANAASIPVTISTEQQTIIDDVKTAVEAIQANQLGDGHNVTVDNGTGAAAVNIQDGGNSITIDATSLPLPTGAATSANQLPDGHNVTVDNGAGIAAVNIQDGGNSITVDGAVTVTQAGDVEVVQPIHDDLNANANIQIGNTDVGAGNPVPISDNGGSVTVDGTVASTQSGTWNINNVSGTVSLPTGAATAANQLPDGHNVTVDNGAGVAAVNIQDGGNSITVDGAVTVSGTATVTQASDVEVVQPTHDDLNANANVQQGNTDVSDSNPLSVKGPIAEGASYATQNPFVIAGKDLSNNVLVPTMLTVSGLGVFGVLIIDALGGTPRFDAHNAVDSGGSTKIGGRSVEDVYAETAVADDDRTDALFTNFGQQHIVNHRHKSGTINIPLLEITYSSTTKVNGDPINTHGFRTGTIIWEPETTQGAPTRIRLDMEVNDGTNWVPAGATFWQAVEFEDLQLAGGRPMWIPFKVPEFDQFRFSITCTGVNGSNDFTVNYFNVALGT